MMFAFVLLIFHWVGFFFFSHSLESCILFVIFPRVTVSIPAVLPLPSLLLFLCLLCRGVHQGSPGRDLQQGPGAAGGAPGEHEAGGDGEEGVWHCKWETSILPTT